MHISDIQVLHIVYVDFSSVRKCKNTGFRLDVDQSNIIFFQAHTELLKYVHRTMLLQHIGLNRKHKDNI